MIADVLAGLVEVQKGLRISAPVPVGIQAAFGYPPNRDSALPDMPCWLNGWDLIRIERHATGGTMRHFFTINSQLFVYDADLERAAQIASAFYAPYARALNQNITLNGTCSLSDLRGGAPTLGRLEWSGGKVYIGLNLLLDVMTQEAVAFA